MKPSILSRSIVALAATTAFHAAHAHPGADHSEHHAPAAELPRIVIDESDAQHPWTGLDLNNDPSNFQFAIITDNTTGGREGVLEDAFRKLNWLQPEFVMSVGDLIQGYTEDRKQLDYEWNEFEGFVSKLQMPFFYVPGNHDYTNPTQAQVWKERFGDSYYSFTYHDVFCLVLNSNDLERPHAMSQEQVDWALKEISDHPDPRWTMVFIHTPLWDGHDTSKWQQIEDALQDRPFTVLAGHHHRYVKHERNGSNFYTLATTGGNSELRGPRFGEFDHVVWVTMTDDGPVFANLILEGIWADDVRDEEIRDVQAALIDDGSLSLQPILYRKGRFKSESVQFRFTNDTDYPVQLDMQFKQLENVVIKGQRSGSWSMPPNEVLNLDFEVENQDAKFEQGVAAEMDWRLAFERGDETIEFEGVEPLAVVQELPIQHVKTIKVDADLRDWKSLPFSSPQETDWHYHRHWDGPSDSRFEFGVAENGDFLYVGIKVYDDAHYTSDSDSVWNQDSILVQIDARPEAVRGTNKRDRGPLNFNLIADDAGEGRERRAGNLPEGSLFATTRIEGGYVAEIALPRSYLDEEAGGSWEGIRLNITLNDKDPNKDGLARIFWNRSWSSDDSLSGSGSFYRTK